MKEMRCREYATSCLFAVAILSRAVLAQQPLKQPRPPGRSSANAKAATLDPGTISGDIYRNPFFGFACKIPFGWVDRTKEMSEDSTPDSNEPKKSVLLLAAFEHPPEATGDSVNSAIVVAAEAASSYPGLHTAEQYFGLVTELAKSKGLRVLNEPYDYPVGARQLVRGDFSKPLANLTMHQSTLVMLEKGYIVSFTFIGGGEDEVDGLVENLSFARKESPAPRK
jgi:hypothetical protein